MTIAIEPGTRIIVLYPYSWSAGCGMLDKKATVLSVSTVGRVHRGTLYGAVIEGIDNGGLPHWNTPEHPVYLHDEEVEPVIEGACSPTVEGGSGGWYAVACPTHSTFSEHVRGRLAAVAAARRHRYAPRDA